jgi:hypothetical protein
MMIFFLGIEHRNKEATRICRGNDDAFLGFCVWSVQIDQINKKMRRQRITLLSHFLFFCAPKWNVFTSGELSQRFLRHRLRQFVTNVSDRHDIFGIAGVMLDFIPQM